MPRELPRNWYRTEDAIYVRNWTPEERQVLNDEAGELEAQHGEARVEQATFKLTEEEMAELQDVEPEGTPSGWFKLSEQELSELEDAEEPTAESYGKQFGSPEAAAIKNMQERRANEGLYQVRDRLLEELERKDLTNAERRKVAQHLEEVEAELGAMSSGDKKKLIMGAAGAIAGGLVGGPVGAIAGGAMGAGAAGFQVAKAEGEDTEEALKEGGIEAGKSLAIDAATLGAGRVLRPLVRGAVGAGKAGRFLPKGMEHVVERPSLEGLVDALPNKEAAQKFAQTLEGIEDAMPMAAVEGSPGLGSKMARLTAGGTVTAELKHRGLRKQTEAAIDALEEAMGGRTLSHEASAQMDSLINAWDEIVSSGNNSAYRKLDELAEGTLVDVRAIKAAATAALENQTVSKSIPTTNTLQQLARMGDNLTFAQARDQMREIRAALPDALPGHASLTEGKKAVGKIRDAMKEAAGTNEQLKAAFEEANKLHTARMEILDAALIRKAVEGEGAMSDLIFHKLVHPGRPDAIRAFRTIVEDMAKNPEQAALAKGAAQKMRGAFVSSLLRPVEGQGPKGKSIQAALSAWNDSGALKELFPDSAMRDAMQRFAKDIVGIQGGIGGEVARGISGGAAIATTTGGLQLASGAAITVNILGSLVETAYGRKVLTEALKGNEKALLLAATRVARGLPAEDKKNNRTLPSGGRKNGRVVGGVPEGL